MNKTEFLLTCLIEECSEVQKAATKAIRFGLNSHGGRDHELSNIEAVDVEFGHVQAIVGLLEEEGILKRKDVDETISNKQAKITCYMSKAPEDEIGNKVYGGIGTGNFI